MTQTIKIISSKATQHILETLIAQWNGQGRLPAELESVGGVVAAQRVLEGTESFDIAVLASDVLAHLQEQGRLIPGSKVDLTRSGISIAMAAGATKPDISSADAVRQAVMQANTLGYSTGPSGKVLLALLERWGLTEALIPRLVLAPPGLSVAKLVATGKADLGFQQLSEMILEPGIEVLGPLPDEIQVTTVFSAGLVTGSIHTNDAAQLIAYMGHPEADDVKRRFGMEPAY